MKEIVIISGKGGTGKTSLTAALSFVAFDTAVVADCDVDAADMHLIMQPNDIRTESFMSGLRAEIEREMCIKCDRCRQICRFDAIKNNETGYYVDQLKCEGCSYCYHICPSAAINMNLQKVGELYSSMTRAGSIMCHAKLDIGADNSGKLVAKVKQEAKTTAEKHKIDYVIVDGSPGIGCPVISSLSGADFVVIVTEPTLSGFADMKRVCELTKKFMIPMGCIINKADINMQVTKDIESYLKEENIKLISVINYDDDFHKAISEGLSLVEFNRNKWQSTIQNIWETLKDNVNNKRGG